MMNKERILQMVERWPDDISYDKALYHLSVLQAIDEGLKDVEAGRTTDHDEVFDEMERLCDQEEFARLVDLLRPVARRPALFIGNEDPDRADLWLAGFHAAALPQRIPLGEQCRRHKEVLESRGWKLTATSSWRQMLDRKLSPGEIIAELIEIEIEVLNRTQCPAATNK